MINIFKILVKYFFYPRFIIADPRYNLWCFLALCLSFGIVPNNMIPYYVMVWIVYLVAGQNLPKKWIEEFYE